MFLVCLFPISHRALLPFEGFDILQEVNTYQASRPFFQLLMFKLFLSSAARVYVRCYWGCYLRSAEVR